MVNPLLHPDQQNAGIAATHATSRQDLGLYPNREILSNTERQKVMTSTAAFFMFKNDVPNDTVPHQPISLGEHIFQGLILNWGQKVMGNAQL